VRIRFILLLALGLITALAVETHFAQEGATQGETVLRVETRLIQASSADPVAQTTAFAVCGFSLGQAYRPISRTVIKEYRSKEKDAGARTRR